MSNPDLQWCLLRWIRDERLKAEAYIEGASDVAEMGYYDGMADAYLSCFAKVEYFIDIAKERENG